MTDDPDFPDDDPDAPDRVDDPAFDTPNAADPVSMRRRRERRTKAEMDKIRFWQGVFNTTAGRLAMWEILESTGWRETPFAVGPNGFPQPEATWFQAGERAFGLRLYHSWLKLARGGVITMLDEHDPRFADPKKKRGKR